jgi:general secretion pathway protein G
VGRYPTTQEGLAALNQRPSSTERWDGPYLKTNIPPDPWGHQYYYRSPGENGRPYDIYSLGADSAPGGDGPNRDILSWEGSNG